MEVGKRLLLVRNGKKERDLTRVLITEVRLALCVASTSAFCPSGRGVDHARSLF